MKTIDTYHDYSGTPTRAKQERTREEFRQDNAPTAETTANGLAFVKPMNPSAHRPWGIGIDGFYGEMK